MNTDRVVVVTGAAGGVGALLVRRFLANGDTVLASDTTDAGLAALREGLGDAERLLTHAADISSEADCQALADFARQQSGHVDVLINCAGFFPIQPFESMTAADWTKVIDINLTGTSLIIQAVVPLMRGRGWGRIVSFGSGSIFQGTAGQAHYVAAKAGVVGLSRSLARELGDEGITVNVITPGITVTKAVVDHFPPEQLAAQRQQRALHRDEEPEDLVGPVFFLASPDADFITGQILNVDGGNFMR